MKEVTTRQEEKIFETSDPKKMVGYYVSGDLERTWTEDFVDDVTGEVVSVERHELVEERGTLITNQIASEINFFLQSGDIKSVRCSNQCRKGSFVDIQAETVWSVTVQILAKKHKFLMYAQGIDQALTIAKDYIELNYEGYFKILAARKFTPCMIIQNNLIKMNDVNGDKVPEESKDQKIDKHFYLVDCSTRSEKEDDARDYTFMVYAKDVESAKTIIDCFLDQKIKETAEKEGRDPEGVSISISTATIVNCSEVIDREFSKAYFKDPNE